MIENSIINLNDNRETMINQFIIDYPSMKPIFNLFGYEARIQENDIMIYDLFENYIGSLAVKNSFLAELKTKDEILNYKCEIQGQGKDNQTLTKKVLKLNRAGINFEVSVRDDEEITKDVPTFEISINDPENKYINTKLKLSNYLIALYLDDVYLNSGKTKEGTVLRLKYAIHNPEVWLPERYISLYENIQGFGNEIFLENNDLNRQSFDDYQLIVSCHPNIITDKKKIPSYRVDNTIKQMLASEKTVAMMIDFNTTLDKCLPGMKNYIETEYPLFGNLLTSTEKVKPSGPQELIDDIMPIRRVNIKELKYNIR